MKKNRSTRYFAGILAAIIFVTSTPIVPKADELPEQESAFPELSPEVIEIGDAGIGITAPEGAFPEGAVASVMEATEEQHSEIDGAIEKVRDENRIVWRSYNFDIKVLDADQETELQPVDGNPAKISFYLEEAGDENLEAHVYHVIKDEETDECFAEELEVTLEKIAEETLEEMHEEGDQQEEWTITVETDGFSYYTVEFTYEKMQYCLSSGSQVALNEILSDVGLVGEVEEVVISDDSLIEASDESGEWMVGSLCPFETDEWIKVKIGGAEYEISIVNQDSGIQMNRVIEEESEGELAAEPLETVAGESSLYSVAFTYDGHKSDMTGGSTVSMKTILKDLKLKGEVTNVIISDPDLFYADVDKDNEWFIKSVCNFTSEEWMQVDLNYKPHMITVTTESPWTNLQKDLDDNTESTITLDNDITADSAYDRLKVSRNVTIDLNGYTLNRNLSSHRRNGQVIEVLSGCTLTVTDTSNSKGGKITGGRAGNGGGVYVNEGATLILDNVIVEGNHARDDGGGIYCEGQLKTTNAIINDNHAETGGGIYLVGDSATIDLDNTHITSNTADDDAGLSLSAGGNMTIKDCKISRNIAEETGGALSLRSPGFFASNNKLAITDTEISENKAKGGDGGGICLFYGTIEMEQTEGKTCSVKNNESQKNGAGINICKNTEFKANNITVSLNHAWAGGGGGIWNDGETTLTNCTITENQADDGDGGGIRNDGKITVTGGVITKNETEGDYKGNGIYVGKNSHIEIGGSLKVYENGASNKQDIYLHKDKHLNFCGSLEDGANIGVTLSLDGSGFGKFTSGYATNNPDTTPDKFFFSPEGYSVSLTEGEACLGSLWEGVQHDLDNLSDGQKLTLSGDCIAGQNETALQIKGNGKSFEIDLAGYTLNRNRSSRAGSGHVIEVGKGAALTISDSSATGTGTITGGWSYNGGGIYVHKGGKLILKGGNVTKNKANKHGGGIFLEDGATLELNGGNISYNHADNYGGGIYTGGLLTFDNNITDKSVISNNSSGGDGGGVYVDDGQIDLKNASVFGNKADKRGGGLYLRLKSNSTITDCTVKGQNESERNESGGNGGGLYVDAKDITLDVKDTLIEGNHSGSEGGGIQLNNGTLNMEQTNGKACSLSQNEAKKHGGGISVTSGTTFTATGITISQNTSGKNGGGIRNSGSTTIENCIVFGNNAGVDGGGVFTDKDLTIVGGTIGEIVLKQGDPKQPGNTAANCGGGICIDKDAKKVEISGKITATGNTASHGNDLFIGKNKTLTLTDKITGTQIGDIYMYDYFGVFTEKYSSFYSKDKTEDDPGNFFGTKSDADKAVWDDDGKEAKLKSNWFELNKIIYDTPGGNTVTLQKNYTGSTDEGCLSMGNKTITIDLNGHYLNRNCMSDRADGYVIAVPSGGILTITDTSNSKTGAIIGGCSSGDGGGILVESGATLILKGGNISGNQTKGKGGGIYVEKGGTLIFDGGTVSGNIAGKDGGGICVNGTLKTSDDATGGKVSANNAKKTGGGIYVDDDGDIFLKNAEVSYNSSSDGGGGINLHLNKDSIIDHCNITDNVSGDYGGGIRMNAEKKTLTVRNSTTIERNHAREGGGIYVRQGKVDMNTGAISGNIAAEGGGGIKVKSDTATFSADHVTVSDNHAVSEDGGAIKNLGKSTLTVCYVSENTSKRNGGGIFNGIKGDLKLDNCRITYNSSEGDGGGIYNSETLSMVGGSVSENISHGMGGGICAGKLSVLTGIEGDISVCNNVADNTGNDVCLCHKDIPGQVVENPTLTLTGKLEDGGKIGVDLENGIGIITTNYSKYQGSADPADHFFSQGFKLGIRDGEVEIKDNWSKIKLGIEHYDGTWPYKLDGDYTATHKDEGILICDGREYTIDLMGHTLNLNRQEKTEDGHVFNVLNGSTLVIEDSVGGGMIKGGNAEYGGGIYVDKGSTFKLKGGTITGNHADKCGGGVYVVGNFEMDGGAINNNTSGEDGGGVYLIRNSSMSLEGGTISGNRTVEDGGGILCYPGSSIQVSGRPVVKGNYADHAGNDIYLPDNEMRLTVSGKLEREAAIFVAIEGNTGVFTTGYGKFNTDKSNKVNKVEDPALFFTSTEGYSVQEESGEAVLDLENFGETDYEKPFIDRTDQIKKEDDMVSCYNWMSGISGERYLHEINMPGSHDSGMKKAFCGIPDFTSTAGKVAFFADFIGFIAALMPYNDWVLEIIVQAFIDGVYDPDAHIIEFMAGFAQTQEKSIKGQLDEGARQFDIRLNDQMKKRTKLEYYDWHDDGENLWIGHGTNEDIGHFPALKSNDEFLKFNEVLDDIKVFLADHPSETVILNLRDETIVPGHKQAIAERARKILSDRALETNPHTGESYLYKEKGSDDYFAEYTDMPKLKDCRGKIVIMVQDGTFHKILGGFSKNDKDFPVNITDKTNFKDTASQKIREIERVYSELNGNGTSQPLSKDASKRNNELWYWELNCTGENDLLATYSNSITPVDLAQIVNPALIGEGKIFNPGLAGQYIGWVRMDDFCAEYAETIWRTNYFKELDYKTITVKSGLDQSLYPDQTFRILKGTKITIPGNIYKQLPKGQYFSNWEEKPDKATAKNVEEYYEGDEFDVGDDNVIFTAKWQTDGKTPVSIVWKDGKDHDRLRGSSVKMHVTPKTGDPKDIELTSGKHWKYTLEDMDVDEDVIVPVWDKIKTDDAHPNGQDKEGEYRYELAHEPGTGFVFTFVHTPAGKTDVKGTIEWDDDNNADQKRPANVTVHLFENGVKTDKNITVTPDSVGHWKYDFEDQPLYKDAERVEYSVAEDAITDYDTSVQGLNITNTYKGAVKETVEVTGDVNWVDHNNSARKRPQSITVNLMADGVEASGVKPLKVKADEKGQWKFSFDNLPESNPAGTPGNKITYTVKVNDIEDYTIVVTNVSEEQAEANGQKIIAFEVECTLKVDPDKKEASEVTRKPEALNQTYNGKEQKLITKGTCTGGTLMYAIGAQGSSAPDDSSFSSTIPVATDAGNYTIWYFVKGDLFHNDTPKMRLDDRAVIGKRQVTFTGISTTRKYTGKPQSIDGLRVSGLVSGHTHNVEFKARGTQVGEYKGTITPAASVVIKSGDEVVTDNYKISVVAGKLTIAIRSRMIFKLDNGKYEKVPEGYTYDAGTGTISIDANVGDKLTIPVGPVRSGYEFQYWAGSIYYPGETYVVEKDGHNFTAVWKKVDTTPDKKSDSDNNDTKKSSGSSESSSSGSGSSGSQSSGSQSQQSQPAATPAAGSQSQQSNKAGSMSPATGDSSGSGKSGRSGFPDTGDDSLMIWWLFGAILSWIVLMTAIFYPQKRRRDDAV